jgi:hypothetical protein
MSDLPIITYMSFPEKIVMALILFGGYFWLRERARGMNLENQQGKVVIGVFGVLTALLFGEKALLEHWHFGTYTDLLIKGVAAAATFIAVGLLFLKPAPPEAEASESNAPN